MDQEQITSESKGEDGAFGFFFFFLLRPETEPRPLAVKGQSPNHWTTREFAKMALLRRRTTVECVPEKHFDFQIASLTLLDNFLSPMSA